MMTFTLGIEQNVEAERATGSHEEGERWSGCLHHLDGRCTPGEIEAMAGRSSMRMYIVHHSKIISILHDVVSQSEYIAECDKRRVFISGFTGSAGRSELTYAVLITSY